MAKLSFIKGAVTGKLGEFVGAKWKGVNYVRLYSKPANPNTVNQAGVRSVFKAISLFASALYSAGLFVFFPPAKRMTERNSVFKANKQMIANKQFLINHLKPCVPNLAVNFLSMVSNISGNALTGSVSISADVPFTGLSLIVFVYDALKGISLGSSVTPITALNSPIPHNIALPSTFGSPTGSQSEDVLTLVFVAGTLENGKKVISNTLQHIYE